MDRFARTKERKKPKKKTLLRKELQERYRNAKSCEEDGKNN